MEHSRPTPTTAAEWQEVDNTFMAEMAAERLDEAPQRLALLITDHHRAQVAQYYQTKALPEPRPHVSQQTVDHLVMEYGPWSVLDYGCGPQANLQHFASYPVQSYDPAVPEYAATPAPADLVVCWHVVEHVEPACLEAVLHHIAHLAQKAILVAISCEPSTKMLPDGTAWHTVVHDPDWWEATLHAAWPAMEPAAPFFLVPRGPEYRAVMFRRSDSNG